MKEDFVLNFLRDHQKQFISGEEISKKLKVSRAAVWKDMQVLRKLGYDIEAQPHLGYRLVGVPDKLFADEIAFGLKTKLIGKKIFSYEELNSTNDVALKLGEEGSAEGTCVFSEYQKKGRGRLGRHWTCPKSKGVLLSILLRPLLSPTEVSRVTLMTAVSLVRAIQKTTGQTLGIKWPNDVFHGPDKVCGILTELSAEADRVNFVVVGIGVNVNVSSKELPSHAASLKEICGHEVSRLDFTRTFLEEFERDYLRLKEGKFQDLAKDWEEYSVTSGRQVTATMLGRTVHGEAVGIDQDGALWIRKENGLREKITAGDVQIARH